MPIYKNNKNNTYYVSVCYKDYLGNSKRKLKRGFKTRREAKEWEQDFLDRNNGSLEMKFDSFLDLYLEDMKQNWSPVTYSTNNSKIKKWISPYFGEMKINDIKPIDIRKWQNMVKSNDLSPVTQKKIRSIIVAIFNYAVRYYDLKSNPCDKVESMGSYRRDNISFWTLDEFNEFLQFVENPNFKLAYKVLFFTGLRIGELTALRPSDFDFSVPKLSVTRNLQIVDGEELFLEPKTKKSKRDVVLPEDLALEIQDYISRQYGIKEEDRIFYYNKKSYGNKLTKICKEHNLKRIRLHDLRHSHASLLIELGFSPHLIAERLGHESVSVTLEIYSHLYPNKQNEVAKQLNELL